jgi:nitroreductase/NAD-dependent dihydropyrimidine dehydrogenase PreA subunit
MSLLIVDQEKCKKDGICAADCPTAIIKIDKQDGPRLIKNGEISCLHCGHCVAVCPHQALSHKEVPLESCTPIQKDLKISSDQAIQFLRSRRSIRKFKDKPVEKESLQQLIEIARYAPTGSNSQLIRWIVFSDADQIHHIAELVVDWIKAVMQKNPKAFAPYMSSIAAAWDLGFDTVLRQAPGLVLAWAPKEAGNGMVDITLALSYLELAAPTFGLGTCWAGILQGALKSRPEIRSALGLSEDIPYYYAMMIGYPKAKYYRLPERLPPRIELFNSDM